MTCHKSCITLYAPYVAIAQMRIMRREMAVAIHMSETETQRNQSQVHGELAPLAPDLAFAQSLGVAWKCNYWRLKTRQTVKCNCSVYRENQDTVYLFRTAASQYMGTEMFFPSKKEHSRTTKLTSIVFRFLGSNQYRSWPALTK